MASFLGLLLHVLASPFKSQARLEAEIVFLRHQLNLLRRRLPGRPRLTPADLLALSPCAVAAERGGHHPARHDRAMAPSGIPIPLAVEVTLPWR